MRFLVSFVGFWGVTLLMSCKVKNEYANTMRTPPESELNCYATECGTLVKETLKGRGNV